MVGADAAKDEEITYLANLFDARKEFKTIMRDCPDWDVIWEVFPGTHQRRG